jgi:hypothetical protein
MEPEMPARTVLQSGKRSLRSCKMVRRGAYDLAKRLSQQYEVSVGGEVGAAAGFVPGEEVDIVYAEVLTARVEAAARGPGAWAAAVITT